MPPDETPYEFDEAVPEKAEIPPHTKRVRFENRTGLPVDEHQLRRVISCQRSRHAVDEVEVGWTSHLRSPWIAPLFRNARKVRLRGRRLEKLNGLETCPKMESLSFDVQQSKRCSLALLPHLRLRTLGLRVTKPEDIDDLAGVRPLEFLGITSWPLSDLSKLAPIAMRELRLNIGSVVFLRGVASERLEELWLMQCTKLVSAAGIRVPYIRIHTCNKLDLNTLAGVEGLRALHLAEQKRVESFDFVRACTLLDHLWVTVNRITATDWQAIERHPRLRTVWLSDGVPDAAIVQMAQMNPKLLISNGEVYFYRGEAISNKDFFLLVRERTRSEDGDDVAD